MKSNTKNQTAMMNWSGPQFNGDRTKFKFPYLEDLKRQLRATNTFDIASDVEKMTAQISSSSSNGIPDKYELRILDKIDDWEKRNQLGFAIISIRGSKPEHGIGSIIVPFRVTRKSKKLLKKMFDPFN